ncbi:MAG: metallophosphoesterase [Kiritimatiellae bacterium]|nr:metallophosphoesterase [Kiritimatiellia bacterium]
MKKEETKMCRVVLSLVLVGCSLPGQAEMGKPYTHQNFLNDPDEFHFAIVPDRQGADCDARMSDYRKGWEKATKVVNMLRPEFVMSIGDINPASWLSESSVRSQYEDTKKLLDKFEPPFFWVVGNHDIAPSCRHPKLDLTKANEISTRQWEAYNGNTYYSFVYKGVLFIALNTIDGMTLDAKHRGISEAQYAWFKKTLDKHPDVRWTCVFMHLPSVWTGSRWLEFEKENLVRRKYTVFAGDWHQYLHVKRHGHDYYVLAVAGGASGAAGSDYSKRATLLGPKYGEIDHITWVTMTKKDGPVVANIDVNGVFPHDFVNQQNTLNAADENVRFELDYPQNPETKERMRKLKAETDLDALFKSRKEDLERMRKWDDLSDRTPAK